MPRRSRPVPPALAAATVLALALAVALVVLLRGSGGHDSSSGASSSGATSGPESQFEGAPFPGYGIAVPDFTLSNEHGEPVSLSEYRGQVVVLTFLYSTCGGTCIVIAQQIRGALDELEAEHVRAPAVLIVSADPAADTPERMRSFLAQMSLSGRAQYLTGSESRLRAIWRAYGAKPASAGAHVFDEYAPVLLIDPAGRKRVLFEVEELTPEALSHDIRKLE